MSKQALSTPPHISSNTLCTSSSSSSQSTRPCHRLQLLHNLPASLLSQVCSFLSVHETVSILRSTCHALHGSVTPNCLLQSHLAISGRSLPALIAATPATRALISRVPSVDIVYQLEQGDDPQHAMLPLQELRSPVDASRFLFSSLTSLHVSFDHSGGECPTQLGQSSLLSLMQLLEADAASFSSLRRFGIDDYSGMVSGVEFELPFSSLTRLPALTHCHIELMVMKNAVSRSTLVSALSSMPSLTSLDLGESIGACPDLLPLLCSDAATPLLLRLKSLALPYYRGGMDEDHDAFLRRLSALPAPPALQHFVGVKGCSVSYSAAALLSVFSLPHLTLLRLDGWVQRSEFMAFTSSCTCALPPLVTLDFPGILGERDDGAREALAVQQNAVAVSSAARTLFSRFTTLRRLHCGTDIASGVVALPERLPGDADSGCSDWLYRLTVLGLSRLPFTAPVSFPQLTDLDINLRLCDAELELLLSGCPQLLRLRCAPRHSFGVVLIAARCCHRLLHLAACTAADQMQDGDATWDAFQPVVAGPFFPQLISLRLWGILCGRSSFDFSVLRHFTAPPHSQLRDVDLKGVGLTAQHVLPLGCLPRLCQLRACRHLGEDGRVAELEEASRRTLEVISQGAAGSAERDPHTAMRHRERWGGLGRPPLGAHQQQEMRQRLLDDAAARHWEKDNLLNVGRADADTVRAVFFAQLRSVLSDTSKQCQ